ncbi:MAG: hypothetical protein QOG91_333 [Candidatus Parcubacteria bacterium]|jgi:phospholipid N-methyltransferase|nr:hypothetical protein [Candidatus Parcubacteria bacterium]
MIRSKLAKANNKSQSPPPLLFLREALKGIKTHGSLLPSSKFLAQRILERMPLKKDALIVELGAGTGSFTKRIVEWLPKSGRLLVFELNPVLAEYLQNSICDSRVMIVCDDAAFLPQYLRDLSLPKPDCIISGLPLGQFNRPTRQALLSAVSDSLVESGTFLQFQYVLASLSHIREMFEAKVVGFEVRNFPPAFLYECKKK